MTTANRKASRNLFDELLAIRDGQRESSKSGLIVVKGSQRPWEINRQGKMRWYMHPNLDDTAIRSLIVYVQEIPPGSWTGTQRVQGGWVIYIWKGTGYTEINGVRHDWSERDLLNLPILPEGLVLRHVNLDAVESARLIVVQPNLVAMLGVDMGTEFEQLINAPEYDAPNGPRGQD
jgi:gentisate 1,2-dioxygenase